jgi:hypothetical protein
VSAENLHTAVVALSAIRRMLDGVDNPRADSAHALADEALRALGVGASTPPPSGLTNADKCRLYRKRRRQISTPTDSVATPSDTIERVGSTPSDSADGVGAVLLSRALSSPLTVSFPECNLSDTKDLDVVSTGAREAESGTFRLAARENDTETDSKPTPTDSVATLSPTPRTESVAVSAAMPRSTRVPRSNAPPEVVEAWAKRWGIDVHHPSWPKFLDHWRGKSGKDGTKVEWDATWRNWIRNEPSFARANGIANGSRSLFVQPPAAVGESTWKRGDGQ